MSLREISVCLLLVVADLPKTLERRKMTGERRTS